MANDNVFSALSDATRRKILVLLKEGKMTAGDIAKHFSETQATVSYHLNKLKSANLIRENKYKNFIYYQLDMTVFDEILLWISNLKGGK